MRSQVSIQVPFRIRTQVRVSVAISIFAAYQGKDLRALKKVPAISQDTFSVDMETTVIQST